MSTDRTGGRAVSVDVLREFARDRVDLSSLRTVGPVIGVGHTTLHNFLSGANPHPRVHRLLGEWYLRETGTSEDSAGIAALDILAGYFPPDQREAVKADLLDVMVRRFERAELPVPDWIARQRQPA